LQWTHKAQQRNKPISTAVSARRWSFRFFQISRTAISEVCEKADPSMIGERDDHATIASSEAQVPRTQLIAGGRTS
jgi:hypothetical protein